MTGKVLMVLALMLTHLIGYADTLYPLDTPKKAAQFHSLLKELRCLVCQNQDLSDSNASLAKDLRQEVYLMVKRGDSDHEITSYLTSRYGDFILFQPPIKTITLFLWVGPVFFMAVGLFVFWRVGLKRSYSQKIGNKQ